MTKRTAQPSPFETTAKPESARAEPPAPGLPVAEVERRKLDSPLRTMLGLLVLWSSLMFIFAANRMSESHIRLEVPVLKSYSSRAGEQQDQTLLESLEPREKLLSPFSMSLPGGTPRQALASIAAGAKFTIKEDTLDEFKISRDRQPIRFESVPLYKAIHETMAKNKAKSSLGFALQGRALTIFEQKLEVRGLPERKFTLDWSADLALSREPLLIVPTAAIDLWFSVHLRRGINEPTQTWRIVQVQVWKGAESLTNTNAMLDDKGYAQLSMSTVDRIAFSVQRKEEYQGSQNPGRYGLQLIFQSFD